jgi:DegV family protein with EDD domain
LAHDDRNDVGLRTGLVTTTRACALVVDGGAALTEDPSRGVFVVPVRIGLDGADFIDAGETKSYSGFYARLRAGAVASTSTPAPGEYLDAFRRSDGAEVVCLTIPAKWSGMYDAATLAAQMLAQEEGRNRVRVVETQTAAVGLALIARVAAELCEQGEDADTVVAAIRQASDEVRMYGSLATLTYVARSGRVPALIAGISNTLHIRPVFRMQGAETGRVALARTTTGALEALQRIAIEQLDGVPQRVLLFHADAADEAAALGTRLSAVSRVASCETVALSPIAGAYTGPGAFGFAAIPMPDEPA